jgi:hypothetical protein
MERHKIEKMIIAILEQVDHDIAKNYDVEYAEEPEFVEEDMAGLVRIVKRYLKS